MITRVACLLFLAGCAAVDDGMAEDLETLRAPPPGSERYGTFQGRAPWFDYEKVKVGLGLHRDARDHTPTTYRLEQIYDDTRQVTQGTWRVTTGTDWDPDASVIHLEGDTASEWSKWLLLRDDLLLLLDGNLE